ncbi:MAG TPA: homocitrate synthase, partial [Dehalococcoidales bacterium]|nr:homocitrate synthase [Dehalococcoidales bacterium]
PERVGTGREICSGQYGGISGFSFIMEKMKDPICFQTREEANDVLELVRYANVEKHKPLVEDELRFIARYPKIAKILLTMKPLE